MVKSVRITLLLVLLLVAGCGSGQVSTWALTAQDTDAKVLVGYNDGWEAGVVATWHPTDDIPWGPEPTGIGGYVGADTTWLLTAEDTHESAIPPFSWLDGLRAVPYGRLEWLDLVENDNFGNLELKAVAGTRFLLDEKGRASIAVEYNEDDKQGYIGANLRF